MTLIGDQTKYGEIKVAEFTIGQWNYGYRIMVQKCIQHKMKKSLLFLKDVLETEKMKFINV